MRFRFRAQLIQFFSRFQKCIAKLRKLNVINTWCSVSCRWFGLFVACKTSDDLPYIFDTNMILNTELIYAYTFTHLLDWFKQVQFKWNMETGCDLSNELWNWFILMRNKCSRTLRSLWLDKNGMQPVCNNQRKQFFQPTDAPFQQRQFFLIYWTIIVEHILYLCEIQIFQLRKHDILKFSRLRNNTCWYYPPSASYYS